MIQMPSIPLPQNLEYGDPETPYLRLEQTQRSLITKTSTAQQVKPHVLALNYMIQSQRCPQDDDHDSHDPSDLEFWLCMC